MYKYCKCLIVNRACLAGIIMIVVGLPLAIYRVDFLDYIEFIRNRDVFSIFIVDIPIFGFLFLLSTSFGSETYIAYRKACDHIQKYQEIKRFRSSVYCKRVGIEMAARELNISL